MVHAKDVGNIAPPRCNLGCLSLGSRGGGCEDVPECLTKEHQQAFDVINLETYPDKEGAFQKAIQGVLRVSFLALIKAA
jgi:hypothetical protein